MTDAVQLQSPTGQSLRRVDWLILTGYTAILLFWQLGGARLFTSHECYVALGAREMRTTGDLLVPRVDGKPWLEKPPLAHWAIVAIAAVWGGVDEFSARIPSALCGLAGVLMLAQLAARTAGRIIGMLAGLTQVTSVYFITYARLAEADIYLWMFVAGCMIVFAAHWVDPPATPRWWNGRLAFFALLGMTGLVKGPLFGAVLVLAASGEFLLTQRGWRNWLWLAWPPGWLVFIAIGAAWPIAIAIQHPDALTLWRMHVIDRIASPSSMNPKPIWYYFTTIPWQLLPWTIVMLPALPASIRTAWRQPRSIDRFMWIWFLAPLLVLTIVKAKHHQYLIHALTPCSYWAALGLLRWREVVAKAWSRRAWQITVVVLGAAGVAGAIWWGAPKFNAPQLEILIVGVAILGLTTLIGWACARARYPLAASAMFVGLGGLFCYVNSVWLPRTDHFPPTHELIQRLDERNEKGAIVVLHGVDPARYLLYLRSPHHVCLDKEEIDGVLERHPDAYVLTPEPIAEELCARLGLVIVDRSPRKGRGPPPMAVCTRPAK